MILAVLIAIILRLVPSGNFAKDLALFGVIHPEGPSTDDS